MDQQINSHGYKSRHLAVAKGVIACMLAVLGVPALAAGPYTYSTADSPAGGEVTDTATGLVWRRCSEGQTWSGTTCTGSASTFTHPLALSHAASQAGWRLPNVKELASIVSLDRVSPSIDSAAFPSTASSYYWTSSPYVGNAGNAWGVNFSDGYVFYGSRTSGNLYVRLVR